MGSSTENVNNGAASAGKEAHRIGFQDAGERRWTMIRVPMTYAHTGQVYDQAISADGGTAPYNFASAPTGSQTGLPPGVSCSASGVIEGMVTIGAQVKTYDTTIKATDAAGAVQSVVVAIFVAS